MPKTIALRVPFDLNAINAVVLAQVAAELDRRLKGATRHDRIEFTINVSLGPDERPHQQKSGRQPRQRSKT